MKYAHLYALLVMFVFCTSCGQNKTDLSKQNIQSETKDIVASPGAIEKSIHTKYEYTDSIGKRLIIQNSFPRGGQKYTDPNGKKYVLANFWTRIINETDNPVELTIDFPIDSYELPSLVGNYFKIILFSDTMTRDKEDLYYGLTDLESFLDNAIYESSSLKRTINPKESTCFNVVTFSFSSGAELGWQGVDAKGTIRAGLSLKEQNLFYRVNDKEIHCGSINLKNLMLQK